jgi:nicotinamidase-related amidase
VLATALEALSHDFRTVIVEDASCAHKAEVHRALMDFYRHGPLEPLFTVQAAARLLGDNDG